MILQVLQVTILDIATHRIGNPVSLLTADLNETEQSDSSTTRGILQPKVSGNKNLSYLNSHTIKLDISNTNRVKY